MESTPDENDLVYQTYGIDIGSLIRGAYEKLIGGDWEAFVNRLSEWWDIYSIIAIILSLLFFLGFVYAKIRYAQLSEIEADMIHAEEAEWARMHGGGVTKSSKWEDIQFHIGSENPNDWRLAIIEADILLEETLNNAGYVGTTIGEKLKSATTGSFQTLQDAWEAHKVRNEIAHAGSDFVLTKKLANETIVRFERVFREFDVI